MLLHRSAQTWIQQLSCVIHCFEMAVWLAEHVLKGDGRDLASPWSHRSVSTSSPPLLPPLLITTDKGYASLYLHPWRERVVLTCLGLWEWVQVERGLKGIKKQLLKNITVISKSPAKCAASVFRELQDFHKLMKDAELQKQEHGMTEGFKRQRSVCIRFCEKSRCWTASGLNAQAKCACGRVTELRKRQRLTTCALCVNFFVHYLHWVHVWHVLA